VVVCRRPSGLEIHCHGGFAASAAIVADLIQAGANCQSWREWIAATQSSALRIEAYQALCDAQTERVACCLLDQYGGALATAVDRMIDWLANGRTDAAKQELYQLQQSARWGLHLTTPWRVVIAGPPNVGKSSLINALVGYQRALVHGQAGTTRDLLTANTAFAGWPMELMDTAGVHDAVDPIEREGMRQAVTASQSADLVLVIRDVSDFRSEIWQPPIAGVPSLSVGNKCDLLAPGGVRSIPLADSGFGRWDVLVSAVTGQGIEELMGAVVARLVPCPPREGQPIVFTLRQLQLIGEALQAVEVGNLPAARAALSRMDALNDD
jgi:tRNA modification GTPase